MKASDFSDSPSGKVIQTVGGYGAFVPNPLPPVLDYNKFGAALTQAAISLGELAGIGRSLVNPYILQRPFIRREAVSSSAIEGTVTTLTDLLSFEAASERDKDRGDAREVHNYVVALEEAMTRLSDLPISGRLLKEVHSRLLSDLPTERGAKNRPGQYRLSDPAWTGSQQIHDARFVFTPPDHIENTMADLERFIANDLSFPPLIKAALLHYQFETIHPFHDGNGRVGRLLIPLYLCMTEVLPQPLLFISPYLEKHRDEYVRRLYHVSKSGDWENWISFFLLGVTEQAEDFIVRSKKMLDLQTQIKSDLTKARTSALLVRLVDTIFERPIISIPVAAEILGVTYNSAKKNIEKLVNSGVVVPLNFDQGPKLFLAQQVFDLVYLPLEELDKKKN